MQANTITADATETTPAPVRFQLGRLFITPGAAEVLGDAGQHPQEFISHHARLEQGELSDADHQENLFSVSRPLRVFSAFKTARGVKLWVITEANRSSTCLLLPSEY